MTTKRSIEMLQRDGYYAAAELIEQLQGKINRDAELEFMVKFVKDNCFKDDERNCDWLRMLWTAFCLHQDLDVDTSSYDLCLHALWSYIVKNEEHWTSYDGFSSFMCKYLV